MVETDRKLARRAVSGDGAALEVLYRRHVERIFRYAYLRTKRRDVARDIVQEVFLRVTRSVRQFKGDSEFTTWLFAITRTTIIEFARRQQRELAGDKEYGLLKLIPIEQDPVDNRLDAGVRLQVREAILELPGPQRDAIVLCCLSGLNIKDAAGVFGWSESRVKVTLFRARHKLKDLLRKRLPDEFEIASNAAKRGDHPK